MTGNTDFKKKLTSSHVSKFVRGIRNRVERQAKFADIVGAEAMRE